jgi:F420-non-reducing hydrogenase small subunit
MSDKPKIAFYWCASCGGCEEAVIDLGEGLLDLAGAVEIVFWPVALDFKLADLERIVDGGLSASFINGAVRTSEQEEVARLLRRKSQLVIAFGSCAHLGGVPGLANLYDRSAILTTVYPDGFEPGANLPHFRERVMPLDRVIEVDYYVPGCPPTPTIVSAAVHSVLAGTLPEKGAVLAPDRALCDECPRRGSRPEQMTIDQFHRPHEIIADETQCLLAQGLLCLGPATRSGCGGVCINGNMPCTGCFGPTSRVRDFGAKALSAIASMAVGAEDAVIEKALAAVVDPGGTFYRYSLPGGLLGVKPRTREQVMK